RINTLATLRLGRLARAAGVARFLFSSSCSNYGAAASDTWLDEDAPLNPVTPYAVSKVEAETGLDALARPDFTPVFLRSATAYGLSPRLRFDLVVNNLTAWAMATGQVRLKSDGSAWRPLVHVEDIAQAFLRALEAPRELVHRRAFNVGRDADCMQIRDLAQKIRDALPGTEVTFATTAAADRRTYRVSCARIAGLGFRPEWDVARGIVQLRDALRRQPVPVQEFEGPRYGRVAHIRALLARHELTGDLRDARPEGAAAPAITPAAVGATAPDPRAPTTA
ncbi:NAD-dependent epimerase/dehydratase family protein, partial [Pseudooceanicola aestuarii]|uniref:NAD-dependent epimerase/dehydratase family protein n=1 Tax=Pseudooceanicola aestuarii TaxID=2697319 RepID=UPI0013D8909D